MNKLFTRISMNLLLLLSLFISSLANCMLSNIAGTDTILHDDYEYLSLVNGAIAWETGVIRRLYDFGQIFPVYKKDKRGRNIIEKYTNSEQTDPMIRLIHALFYRVPGSIGETDFGATNQLQYQDPVMVIQTIASVIALCENIQAHDQAFKNALQSLATHKNLKGFVPKLIKNPLYLTGQNRSAWKVFFEQAYTKKSQNASYEQQAVNKEVVTNFCENLGSIQHHLQGLLKYQALLGAEMGEVILGALRESDPQNPDALYPPHTVEMILLAFVYKKYSGDRTALKAFYDELNTQFNGKVLWHSLDEQWVKENFKSVTQVEALEQIRNIFVAGDLMQSIKQHFAEFVYDAFQIRNFPTPIGYATVSYEYEKDKKTAGFSDCMCNSMRNFINLYAYDTLQNKFTLEKLQASMHVSQVHPALAYFLKSFGGVNMASSLQAHDAWLTVISNIPYVAYNQMVNGDNGQSKIALNTGKGYIAIPENELNENLLNWLKNRGYQALEKNQYGYELQPSAKNIIIVLDHLLKLNLFSDAGGLAQEFMRPDFIKEYFPKLCAIMKATGFLSSQKDAQQNELGKDFDTLDYAGFNLHINFDLANIICQFATALGHGELRLIKTGRVQSEERALVSLLHKIHNFTGQPSLSLLTTNLIFKHEIAFFNLPNNTRYLYINLFAMPLENTQLLKNIIESAIREITYTKPLKIKMHIKDLLLRLAEKQPDVEQRQLWTLNILSSFVSNLKNEDMHTIDAIRLLKEAAQAAEPGIAAQQQSVRLSALNLFKSLFEKGQNFEEAIQAAEKATTHQNLDIRASALNLFKALVEKGQAIKEAIQTAKQKITDQEYNARKSALYLFKRLIIKAPEETKEAIQKVLANPKLDDDMKQKLGELLKK